MRIKKVFYFVVIMFFIFITHEITHYQINEYYNVENNHFNLYEVRGDFSVLTSQELNGIRQLHSINEMVKDILIIAALMWYLTGGKNGN